MPSTPPQLGYARDGSTRVRKWGWRCLLVAWIGLTLYLAYDKWGGWAKLQSAMLLSQSKCMNFAEAPNRAVFDSNYASVRTRASSTGYTGAAGGIFSDPFPHPAPEIAYSTVASDRLKNLNATRRQLDDWERLRHPSPTTGMMFGGGLFGRSPDESIPILIHQRRSPSGDRLIVLQAQWYEQRHEVEFAADVIVPASLIGQPQDLPGGIVAPDGTPVTLKLPAGSYEAWLRLYAGQVDPNDPAKFTWDYETPDGRGTILGKLRPDDKVEVRILSGPAANVSP